MTLFEVWAPRARRVRVDVDGAVHALAADAGGWWRAELPAADGARYGFLLDDDPAVLPDPRSPRQPDGVHGRSAVHALDVGRWSDSGWTGRPLAGSVLYELHIGTFTPEGTFDAAVGRLDHLVELGVTTVEVMPVNAFNGVHNWGYDGVLWYAVHEPYGGPDGLQRFVDACHARGLAVALDVVYNHLGPSGNYLPRFGPYLSEGRNTWGQSVNLDGPGSDEVRRFVIGNALRWFEQFHIDALRLDAVHALADQRAIHLLEELAVATDSLAARLRRPLTLIAESDLNDPRLITPRAAGGYGLSGQWNDDLHHAVHTAVSGERQGYYADFGSMHCLAHTLRSGFFHAATYSSFRGRIHGRPLDTRVIPGSALLAYTCNHDQIGNRALGDRPSAYLSAGQLAVKAALVLLSAYTPMLFMGEEWGARTPFQFFTSHPEPELAAAVAQGRREEFAAHGWPAGEVPDPQDPATFERSRLDWSELSRPEHARLLGCYRALLALRRGHADLADPWLARVGVEFDEAQRWIVVRRNRILLACNLSETPVVVPCAGKVLLAWDEVEQNVTGTTLPGHCFAVLETVSEPAGSAW
ncbi:malto-oligosyltrehalose trehalohydrolase [Nocardia sp. CDC159]|uniref:Malto-oligosyltrehalose trehalohydrolase n=1 Tax=Nocardia pulmonis TaxID=2951408 RepID=A0A9X2IVJ9_9NOCA|nr:MULTISPECIES: malto-oligosyltrehalose trehalohydrolase [Nocardia]MCM6773288.1 malto-oligosyltrehalose trehalohydrolase [Nocardia pulmonis]MCM6786175.1 malto-oligosyltrehalose trehalohydrolase [Nocardia sp. CDC159]